MTRDMTPEEEHEEVLDYIAALTGNRYEQLNPSQAIRFAESLDHYHSEGYDSHMCEQLTLEDMDL